MMLGNRTRDNYQTLLDAFVLNASDVDATAVFYLATDAAPIEITWRQFQSEAHRYALAISNAGISTGDLVIIASTQCLTSMYAFWGALLIGAIPSMLPAMTPKLDPDVYRKNMIRLVQLSDVRLILTDSDFVAGMSRVVGCRVLDSGDVDLLTPDSRPPLPRITNPGEIAFLQHSSGTTGLQKGVALTHAAVLNQLASYSDAIDLTPDDVIISWLPLYHDMGLIAGFLLPLLQGIPLAIMSPFDWVQHPALLLRAIDIYRGTLCWMPNFAFNHCANRIRKQDSLGLDLSSMRAFINCSESVRYDSHQLFLDRFSNNGVLDHQIAVSYAMAENVFAVSQTPIGQSVPLDIVDCHALSNDLRAVPSDSGPETVCVQVSCGPTIQGTIAKIVDNNGNILPERHVGDVLIKSHCMLTGYFRQPGLMPFDNDGWYHTGDRGYIASNQLYIVGRSKDLIINAGQNIYPQDIEAIVNTVEGVHPGRVVVFGVPDEREGTELIAVLAEVDTLDAEQRKKIVRNIRKSIAKQSSITANYVELVEPRWLVKTSSGKIARPANRDKWLEMMRKDRLL